MSLRGEVYDLDGGRCVGCGRRQRRNAGPFEWSCHHVIKRQQLRRRRVPSRYVRGPLLCVLACWDCHLSHEGRSRVIPLDRLPARVLAAADALGPWAHDAVRRYHPEARS